MKKIFLNVLKEIGIALGILVVLVAAVVVAFKDQLPYDEEIRQGEEYVKANIKGEYSVSSSDRISEVTAVTVTHEADSNQIIDAENEVRVQTGKYTPFGTISSASDLPTEKVGVTVSIDSNNNNNTNNANTTDNNNSDNNNTSDNTNNNSSNSANKSEIEYPDTENPVQKIEKEQSESSESAANRRFENKEE